MVKNAKFDEYMVSSSDNVYECKRVASLECGAHLDACTIAMLFIKSRHRLKVSPITNQDVTMELQVWPQMGWPCHRPTLIQHMRVS